jgi:hypothetical protein
MINTIDPVTGHDISDVRSHPHLQNGKLTIDFESEQTRDEFLNTPLDHPYEHALGEYRTMPAGEARRFPATAPFQAARG